MILPPLDSDTMETSPIAERQLHARLFGTFRLSGPGGDEISISSKRGRALLAMLCLEPDTAFDRDRLCELLWRGRFRAQARASLRQTLLGLKKQLAPIDPDFFEVSRDTVAVRKSAVHSDLAALEAALAGVPDPAASELLVEIGGRTLLAQFDFGEALNQWLEIRRAQVGQRLQSAVEKALRHWQQCGNQLEHSRLAGAWALWNTVGNSDRIDERIRLAVLPFQCAGSIDVESHFAFGLVDELITTLGRIPQLLVAGRGSSLNLKRSLSPLTEVARTLRVSHLLQGSVQRFDEEVRVRVSLIDGRTGFASWSQRYGGTTDNLFALQEDIARAVSHELGVALELDNRTPMRRPTTSSKAAYERYLQGRALTARAIGDGVLDKAVELLEAALEIDPRFSACWTALAEAHVYTAVYTPCLDRNARSARMAECAAKAIELDPGQGHARAMLGIHRWTQNDPVGALDLAFEASRLEPENADVTLRLGSFLLYIGRTRDALPYIEAAIDQDPVNGRNFAMLSVAHLNLGHLDEAIAAGRRMVDLGMPSMWLAVAMAAAGQHERAADEYRKTRFLINKTIFPPAGSTPLSGDALDAYWTLAANGVCSGRPESRLAYCAALDQLHTSLADPADTSIVMPAIWMGYGEMVFKTLGRNITPANVFGLMSLWADIEPIRKTRLHPDFMAFAERIGLVTAWEKYGWPDLLARPDLRLQR